MKKLLFCLSLLICLLLCSCTDEGNEALAPVIPLPDYSGAGALKDSLDLEYRLSDDGTYYAVCSIGSCTDTTVVIPSTYNDKPVKVIDANAFANRSDIIRIVIPDGVTSIGEGAFSWCHSLIRVTIGKDVAFIGENAFADCYKLTEVYNRSSLAISTGAATHGGVALHASLVTLSSKSSIVKTDDGFYFYKDSHSCSLLGYDGDKTELTLPGDFDGSSYKISRYALSGNTKITKVTIPRGVTAIGDYAFSGCHSLNAISLPSGLASIGNFAFQSCFCLESVAVPDTVTSIGEFAFFSCPMLKVAIIPKSVTHIGKNAFSGCASLTISTSHTSEPEGWVGFNPNGRPVQYGK